MKYIVLSILSFMAVNTLTAAIIPIEAALGQPVEFRSSHDSKIGDADGQPVEF